MSLSEKNQCFHCKIDAKDLGRSLKVCSSCRIAKYCSRKCQLSAYFDPRREELENHQYLCVRYKNTRKEAEAHKLKLRSHGINFNDSHGLGLLNCKFSSSINMYIAEMENAILYKSKIAREFQDPRGLQIVLDEFMELLGHFQPIALSSRYWIPMVFLDLGKDQECYDFIKFWLDQTEKRTLKDGMDCDGIMSMVPTKRLEKMSILTMNDQDKKENIFEALEICKSKSPFVLDFVFYICLVIIKLNESAKESDLQARHQLEEQAREILEYIEKFHPGITKPFLDFEMGEVIDIPKCKGLAKSIAEKQFNRFKFDLQDYFKRAPEIKAHLNLILTRIMVKQQGKALKWKVFDPKRALGIE